MRCQGTKFTVEVLAVAVLAGGSPHPCSVSGLNEGSGLLSTQVVVRRVCPRSSRRLAASAERLWGIQVLLNNFFFFFLLLAVLPTQELFCQLG